uniref:ADNP homeobox 2a n=1 Tax=Cyprinus carpio TaxID=7962 RepID=A0A8C2EJK9_CYPCA
MYQIPVKNLTKLRRPRKRVKNILCDIGMQQCQDLLETYKCFDAGDASFDNTEWDDFTDGHVGKKKKKYPYRSQALCCSLCWYSSRSVPTFRSHIHRCHWKDLDVACLLMCPYCPFVSSPKVTEQHIQFFHMLPSKTHRIPLYSNPSHTLAHTPKTVSVTVSADAADDRYTCATCGYHDSLLYVMKKHVLVNHYAAMLDRYFGLGSDSKQKTDGEQIRDGASVKYHCKVCKLPAETIEHLLYHILSSEKHKDLHWQIMPCIIEKDCTNQMAGLQNLLNLAPKTMQQVTLLARPNYVPQQMQQANGNGTVLLAGPSSAAALFCSPGAGQMFLSPQTQALLSGTTVAALQNAQQPQPASRMPINMMMPNMPQSAPKTVPITMAMPRLPQTHQAQQVLLPPGVQVNLPGEMGVRSPFLVTQGLQLNQSVPRSPLIASQSVRLIPTGNKVNGVPTYTLAPVQVTVPVQSGPAQVVLTQNQISQPTNSAVVPAGLMPTVQRAINRNSVPNELAVLAPFLKKHDDHTVKCLRCKILLTEQGIFQHLLHGLKCLFCPQMFYSFKQIMEHTNKEHSLKIKENRHFIKEQFSLDCDDEGNLMFNTFNLNTDVPKDLLDNRSPSVKHGGLVPQVTVKKEDMSEMEHDLFIPGVPVTVKKEDVSEMGHDLFIPGVPVTVKKEDVSEMGHDLFIPGVPVTVKKEDVSEMGHDLFIPGVPVTVKKEDVSEMGHDLFIPGVPVTVKKEDVSEMGHDLFIPGVPVTVKKEDVSEMGHDLFIPGVPVTVKKEDVSEMGHDLFIPGVPVTVKKEDVSEMGHDLFIPGVPVTVKKEDVSEMGHDLFIPGVPVTVKKEDVSEMGHDLYIPGVTVKQEDVNEMEHGLFVPEVRPL